MDIVLVFLVGYIPGLIVGFIWGLLSGDKE